MKRSCREFKQILDNFIYGYYVNNSILLIAEDVHGCKHQIDMVCS